MPEPSRHWDVVLAAGGTGGHVLPALAVADALEAGGLERARIGFIGGLQGSETTAVAAAGLDFVGLDVRGLRRDLSAGNVRANAVALWHLWRARARARKLLEASGTRVVCGLGGYASLPAVLAAGRRRGCPHVYLYESNSVPGLATRLGARRAVYVGTAFEGTVGHLANARRIGFMVRPELEGLDREQAREAGRSAYGVGPGRRVLAVVGGSQGARSVNDATLELLDRWANRPDLAIVHIAGDRHYADVRDAATAVLGDEEGWRRPDRLGYVLMAFETAMERVYGIADLVVCRSGAATCAELAATATPAICVPYPHATADHQTKNAAELVAAGAAELVADADVGRGDLLALAAQLLGDDERLAGMRKAAASLGSLNGRVRLAADILSELGVQGSE